MSDLNYANNNETIQLDNNSINDLNNNENVAYYNNVFNDENIKDIIPPTNNFNNTLDNIVNTNKFGEINYENSVNNTLNNMNFTTNTDYDFGVPLDEFESSNNSSGTPANNIILLSPPKNNNINKNINISVNDSINSLDTINKNVANKMNEKNIDSIDYDYSNNDHTYLDENLNRYSSTYFNNDNLEKSLNVNTNRVSDNFELEFPARMADGRLFTDYKSSGILNSFENELNSTLEYRLYLQNNAEKIINNNYDVAESLTKCNNCPGYEIIDSKILLTCSKESCTQNINDSNGLGLDVQYIK